MSISALRTLVLLSMAMQIFSGAVGVCLSFAFKLVWTALLHAEHCSVHAKLR